MLIDSHAHVNFKAFNLDADQVIKRTLAEDTWLVNVGSQYPTSKKAVDLAEAYAGVFAAIGLHPIHTLDGFVKEDYRALAKSKKVVAIGEIGLDYKEEYVGFKEAQKAVFLDQIALAQELALPIIFHCRKAHKDLFDIIKSKDLKGVVHCFTGNKVAAKNYLDLGLYLGFNGIIFKLNLDEVIRSTPLERILIETDCPYLTPPQQEGRNEPLYVKYVAERIAELKKISYQEVSRVTTENAIKLFKLNEI